MGGRDGTHLHRYARRHPGRRLPSQRRRITIGPCPEITSCGVETHPLERCPGHVEAVLDDNEACPDGVCNCCGTVTMPAEYRRLARRMGVGGRLVTADEVVLWMSGTGHRPVGEDTLRQWAHRGHVRSVAVNGRAATTSTIEAWLATHRAARIA